MATSKSDDPSWKYFHLQNPANKNNLTCNFCNKETKGGAYRAKQHLLGGFRNVSACKKCPTETREEIRNFMEKKQQQRELQVVQDFDDDQCDEDEDDVMEVQDHRGKGKRPISASSVGSVSVNKKANVKGPMDLFFKSKPPETSKDKDGKRQTTLNEHVKKELREKACQRIARWMYDCGIAFNSVRQASFKAMVHAIGQYGPNMKPPSYHEVRVPLLRKEVENTNTLMQDHKEAWARFGCTVMCDGWTDRSHRHLINFLVNSPKGTMFIESVDVSSYVQDGLKIYELIDNFIERIGSANVVQVVTDSASNNVLAGKFLMSKYQHMFWTPCAAHCLDLMLEDLGKLSKVKGTVRKAIILSGYIYNHTRLLNMFRKYTGQRNLLRPAKTRFATAFITIARIYKFRDKLRQLFTSEEWTTSSWAKEARGKQVVTIVLNTNFWKNILYSMKISAPLVKVLRMVDGEKKPPMGYIYEAMERAKEVIKTTFKENETEYNVIWDIIDRRWRIQLHRPLHAAGHFLNPEIYYSNKEAIDVDQKVQEGFFDCVSRMIASAEVQDKISLELTKYKEADGLFGKDMAKRQRSLRAPADWWASFGSSTPNLQKFAIRVLSLTCSSSGCERNWSVFEHTIVCFPFMDGVLELGTTELVPEDPTLIQHVTTSFWKLTSTACSEKSVPCSPLAEDEDNLGPNINHEPVDTNALALENHSLMIENPLESDTPIFPLAHNSYSKKEANLIEEQTAKLHGNTFEETKVGSTDDSCNELRSNQHTDVSLRVEGLIGTSQTQSRGLMVDEFHLHGSLNSCDHIAQSFIGTQMAHPSPKGERVKNYELDYLQEGNHTKHMPMDLDADKCHFARIFHGDRSHYAGTLFAILSHSKQTYTIPYFRNSSHESSFTLWKGGSHSLKLPINIPQRVLKKILLDSVSMCGSQSLKLHEDNGLKNKVCKPEGEDVGASHMLSERRRREKLNEKFLILRSLVPSISKVDKASILADTIEYLKDLERRVEELESYRDQVEREARGRRKHLDITERTSDNYGSNGITDGKRPSTSKRKACFIEDVIIDVNVSVDDNEALVEVHCPWRDCLLLHIVEAMSNLNLDAHSVQSSTINGILAINLRAKFRSSHIASQGTIKRALQKVVGRC